MMKLFRKTVCKSYPKEITTYTVESGDNLWDISLKLGVAHKDLIKVNPLIKNPDLIYAGQVINIP